MDSALEAAYRAARYRIATPRGELVLRVDEHSQPLADLLHQAGVSQAAVLTAFNPHSQAQPAQWNHDAQQRLLAELEASGCRVLHGCNSDATGHWVEHSALVLGMELPAARQYASRYQQVAFVWIDAEATPRLVETDAARS